MVQDLKKLLSGLWAHLSVLEDCFSVEVMKQFRCHGCVGKRSTVASAASEIKEFFESFE